MSETESLVTENLIHVLQTAAGSLGIEEPGDRDEGGIEDSPDDVESVAEICDGVGCNIHDHEI